MNNVTSSVHGRVVVVSIAVLQKVNAFQSFRSTILFQSNMVAAMTLIIYVWRV